MERLLQDLGLTQGEIAVYRALSDIGPSTTGTISNRAGVHTSKVYPILDRLITKGLVAYVHHGRIRHYHTTPPQRLLDLIRDKRDALDQQAHAAAQLVRDITAKQTLQKRQWAAVYEGRDGIRSIFQTLLDDWEPGDPYLVLAPGHHYQDPELNAFFIQHHRKRRDRGITVHALAHHTHRTFYENLYRDVDGFVFRWTDIELPATMNIVRDQVCTLLWGETPTAFAITSPALAKQYRTFFNALWERAAPDTTTPQP